MNTAEVQIISAATPAQHPSPVGGLLFVLFLWCYVRGEWNPTAGHVCVVELPTYGREMVVFGEIVDR